MGIDAARFKTYNNVIDTLKCVAEQHLMIQEVTTGDIWDIDLNKNTIFPLCHINTIGVEATLGQLVHNFQIVIADLVEPDPIANEQEVLSRTLAIALDIISIFKNGETLYLSNISHGEEARYWTQDSFSLEPFTERFDNCLSGWTFNLPIVIEYNYDTCSDIITTDICVK